MRRLLSRNFAAHPGGLESDARSLLFDLENAETEKPCPQGLGTAGSTQ
jgi:hypothetical protein